MPSFYQQHQLAKVPVKQKKMNKIKKCAEIVENPHKKFYNEIIRLGALQPQKTMTSKIIIL